MNYEEKARGLFHKDGANCSQAVAAAFADKIGLSEEKAMEVTPPPRSIEGKCGAVLASEMILEKLSIDKKDEFEEKFKKLNKYIECKPLVAQKKDTGKTCHDIVADAARILDEMISE